MGTRPEHEQPAPMRSAPAGLNRQGARGFASERASEREPLLEYSSSAKVRHFQENSKGRGSTRRFLQYFFALWLIPLAISTFTSLIYMLAVGYAPFWLHSLTTVFVGVFMFASFYMALDQRPSGTSIIPHSYRRMLYAVNAFAVILGAVVGEGLHDIYMTDYVDYYERRHYTNVSPDESAAAHADASVVVFAEGSRPDTTKWVGLDTFGYTYCVAPITSGSSEISTTEATSEIQYWAVGKDCCKDTYTCDDVGVHDAHSGLVIHKRTGHLDFLRGILIEDMSGNFEEAVKTAIAKYDLASSDKALMLTFVKDIAAARDGLYWHAWRVWLLGKLFGIAIFLSTTLLILMASDEECARDLEQLKSDSMSMFVSGFPS